MNNDHLTERQKKWFATVQANFEAKTGKPLAAWVEIMKTCPETGPKKQAAWLKENYGIGVNHAAHILDACRPAGEAGWDDPQALREALWKDAASLSILEAIERHVAGIDGVVTGQRKGYTAFSKTVQFAATRPLKGGRALLGLKLDPASSARLALSVRKESWSERLTAIVELDDPSQVDAELAALIRAASDNG